MAKRTRTRARTARTTRTRRKPFSLSQINSRTPEAVARARDPQFYQWLVDHGACFHGLRFAHRKTALQAWDTCKTLGYQTWLVSKLFRVAFPAGYVACLSRSLHLHHLFQLGESLSVVRVSNRPFVARMVQILGWDETR